MSTVWLTGLVAIGLLSLVFIAYGAHRMEMSKLEKLRLAGLHKDRYRNLQFVLDVAPLKAFKGELPTLIARSMVLHMEQVISLQGQSPDVLHHLQHAKRLQQKIGKGEALKPRAKQGSLHDNLKDVRRATRLLKEFILQQHRGGFLSKLLASQYIKSLQEINIVAAVDGLLVQAVHAQGEGNIATSLRYYQLALGEIRKCKNKALLTEQNESATKAILDLKAREKAAAEANQEINQKLASEIKSDLSPDSDDFDMRQFN